MWPIAIPKNIRSDISSCETDHHVRHMNGNCITRPCSKSKSSDGFNGSFMDTTTNHPQYEFACYALQYSIVVCICVQCVAFYSQAILTFLFSMT